MKLNRWVLIAGVAFVFALAVVLFILQYRLSLVCMSFPIVCGVQCYHELGKKNEESKFNYKLNFAAFVASIFLFIASIFFNAMMLR